MKALLFVFVGLIGLSAHADCVSYSGTYKADHQLIMVIKQPSCELVDVKYYKNLNDLSPSYHHVYTSQGNAEDIDTDTFLGRYTWYILQDHLVFHDVEIYNKNDRERVVALESISELRKLADGSIEEKYIGRDSRVSNEFSSTTVYKKIR